MSKDCVFIFDIILCDGEQLFGVIMIYDEKLEIVVFLDDMGVDIIEVGFFIVFEGDFCVVIEIV